MPAHAKAPARARALARFKDMKIVEIFRLDRYPDQEFIKVKMLGSDYDSVYHYDIGERKFHVGQIIDGTIDDRGYIVELRPRTKPITAAKFKDAEVLKIIRQDEPNIYHITLSFPDKERTYKIDTEIHQNREIQSFRRGDLLSGVVADDQIIEAKVNKKISKNPDLTSRQEMEHGETSVWVPNTGNVYETQKNAERIAERIMNMESDSLDSEWTATSSKHRASNGVDSMFDVYLIRPTGMAIRWNQSLRRNSFFGLFKSKEEEIAEMIAEQKQWTASGDFVMVGMGPHGKNIVVNLSDYDENGHKITKNPRRRR